ncbi:MAG: type II toxin-antitoxin system HicA family toxin [candidate division NC10 bacterium]|nr:type II toxin-antitoxin system HicA family toxin [candidate division NC10 bacterium]MDE2322326.1 type II toxin-antitoxin system HicA family toxin [candidate division NC10 bacterium]
MAKLPVISGREAGKAFAKLGFAYDHHRGSHMIYYHLSGRHLSIPDHNELDRGTLRKLIRYAGITVDEFLSLLQDS